MNTYKVNNRKNGFITALAAAAAVGGTYAMPASATLIGVQFSSGGTGATGQGTALTSGQQAGVIPQENFNAEGAGTISQANAVTLLDSTGAITAVTLYYTTYDDYSSGTGTSTANDTLLSGKVGTNGYDAAATFTLSNVPDGAYDLIVYTMDDKLNQPINTTLGATGFYTLDQQGSAFAADNTFVQAANTAPTGTPDVGTYVEFTNVTPTSGQIVLTVSATGTQSADISGFQLESVPEPAALALLAAAGVGILLLGRRRRLA